ncbi:hypothetical protein ACUNV4_13120 [Granulosicoccus sp. 3-233]|uniref:hypothetical protein n=1 Tax=Granulosicoccus sp. 3-233 TaxID=3417969 RepID=UPI003D333C80
MYSRWTALAGLAVVLAPLTASAADVQASPLVDTDFQDWNGVLSETALSDQSVLSEYSARTYSRDRQGAVLEVTFIPRFGCTPLLRITLPEQGPVPASGQELMRLVVDGEPFDMPALIDGDSSTLEYSYLAGHDGQQDMRLLLDRSSRLQIQRADIAEDLITQEDDPATEPVRFSLLGSRLSVLAVESRCQAHTPKPFKLSESD